MLLRQQTITVLDIVADCASMLWLAQCRPPHTVNSHFSANHHLAAEQPAHISTQGALCGPFAFLEASKSPSGKFQFLINAFRRGAGA